MKFTLSWLKDFLDTDASATEIADALTGIGLELESLHDPADELAPFTIARVVEARQHPNADRLRVCMVDTGDGGDTVQVVCGAPNARTGLIGVFAPAGTHIPGTGMYLKPGVIRGEASNGMLCSERELRISDDHDGIIDLPEDAPLGANFANYAGLSDPVFDIGVTPNRPDALGVYGIARDLAAKGIGTLKPLVATPVAGAFKSPITVDLKFDDPGNAPCPLFVGRYIRGVKNGPSPARIQRLLRAVGLRPISALVDITNYMTLTYGRPLHVFDAGKVTGNIHVRFANTGEEIAALDGKAYILDDTMTVIADDNGAEAIGGVIGGEASGCSDGTVNVFVESAWFDPIRTATTGRRLGVISDARYRFERGVDPLFTQPGAEIATQMILDLCGGEASELIVAGTPPARGATFDLRLDRVKTLAGVDIPADTQLDILARLGFEAAGAPDAGNKVTIAIPPWRPDVHGEADLVEEITRIHGFDKIGHVALPRLRDVAKPSITLLQRRRFNTARALAARGLNEAVTWSFLPREQAELFGGGQAELQLANPISTELSDMRPSLLPNLIAAAGRNAARGFADLAMSEVGQVYHGDQPDDEHLHASGIRAGNATPRHWSGPVRAVDLYDAKADALAALAAAGAPVANLQTVAEGPHWYHPGRVGTLQLGPKIKLAHFGEVHPRILSALDVAGPMVAFEAVLDAIPQPRSTKKTRPALGASDLQPVTRDFAFVVNDDVSAASLIRAAKGADKALIRSVSVFDLFSGASIGEGKTSIAIEVTLQPREQTLTDTEIEAVSGKIIAAVDKATGGTLRG
ncbi:MAG: phenylalanine--tRNA ligase subunit beta [Alphaproteobacteria bacterium]